MKTRIGKTIICFVFAMLVLSMPCGCGKQENVGIRVGSLKGPTSIGILQLMQRADHQETADQYTFHMAANADELLPMLVKGELDIALIPANVSSVLYNRTEGGVKVIDINTLGVLYLVTGSAKVDSFEELRGATICLTGKGTTPEASLCYLMEANGISKEEYRLMYQSEATEVAAMLAENPDLIGLLPQPFVTAALMQNDRLSVVMDLNEEWSRLQEASGRVHTGMVTGVTVVRSEFLEQHPDAVERFLEEHASSVRLVQEQPEDVARLAVEAGIVSKEAIALRAIPELNITCLTGTAMKEVLGSYLDVLENFETELVGGSVPADDFYYVGE